MQNFKAPKKWRPSWFLNHSNIALFMNKSTIFCAKFKFKFYANHHVIQSGFSHAETCDTFSRYIFVSANRNYLHTFLKGLHFKR